jgi:hypothetical protein
MKNNPIRKGVVLESIAEIESVTREDVHVRARELAFIDGRTASNVTQADYEQAKRELTGQSDLDQQEAVLDALPEEIRGDPTPDSTGHQMPESPSEEEDEEGRSESEQIAEKGVEDAERNQVLEAAKAATKQDKKES